MRKLKALKERIHKWYLGEFVEGFSVNNLVYPGGIRRPRIVGLINFVRREYKWIIGLIIAMLMIYLTWRG